jgi:anaerobic ribonucleoside-triphosphate reductase
VSTDNDRIDHNYSKYLPLVKTRKGDFLFVPGFIYQSLLKETDLSKRDAKKVTEQVVRFLISADLKLITAPLIREVVNVQLLRLGFERERLQYTRIGLPFYDLKRLSETIEDDEERFAKILNWITSEFKAVNKLITERE